MRLFVLRSSTSFVRVGHVDKYARLVVMNFLFRHPTWAAVLTTALLVGCTGTSTPVQAPTAQTDQSVVQSRAAASESASGPVTPALVTSSPNVVASVIKPDLPVQLAPDTLKASLEVAHIWQSLNNCGPASVVMILSHLSVQVDQESARVPLRGEDLNRGMGPTVVGAFVAPYGLRATWRVGGTNALMRKLVTNGFMPMVTQFLDAPNVSRVGHWRIVRGFDETLGQMYVADPMKGANIAFDESSFGDLWAPFGYRYLVIYKPEDEAKLRTILGEDWNESVAKSRLYTRAVEEARVRDNPFYDFALGQAAFDTGRYVASVKAFERGFERDSGKGVFTMRASYPNALLRVGRIDDAKAALVRMNATQ